MHYQLECLGEKRREDGFTKDLGLDGGGDDGGYEFSQPFNEGFPMDHTAVVPARR